MRILTLCLLLICACADRNRFDGIQDPVGKAVFFAEQDRRNKWHALSDASWSPSDALTGKTTDTTADAESADPDAQPTRMGKTSDHPVAVRKPSPAFVDQDSKIHLFISKDQLVPDGKGELLETRAAELKERKNKVVASLVALGEVIEARAAAVEAYRTKQGFGTAKKQYGKRHSAFLKQLKKDWGEEALEPLEEQFKTDPKPDPVARKRLVERWLEARVVELDAAYREIEAQMKRRSVKLKLEAWLAPSKKGQKPVPVPLHLPGYDTLPSGTMQSRDRFGLNLTKEEMAAVQAQLQASKEVADAANAVLRKEKSIREAVLETLLKLSPELGAIADDIDTLVTKYSGAQLEMRLDETAEVSKAFWGRVQSDAKGFAADTREMISALPRQHQKWMRTEIGQIVSVLTTWAKIKDLSTRWDRATPENYADLMQETMSVLREVRALSKTDVPKLALDILDGTESFLATRTEQLAADGKEAVRSLFDSDASKALQSNLRAYHTDFAKVKTIGARIVSALAIGELTSGELTTVPEVLKVPLNEITDTQLDLMLTPRRLNDTITVRATLYGQDDKVIGNPSTASFVVKQFGWHGWLSPAVVLVKPDKLAAGNDNFRFAPMLSWLLGYNPRPEEGKGLLEALRPAVGIHSAFLNFEGDQSVQIGLGGTLSLWDGRLQGGLGYNLMADSEEDGRLYYFIGSDLIGLLQAAGLVGQ